jgi:exonuclease III
MVYTYKIATLNINAIKAPIRIQMLEHFLHDHDIDLLCAQEITSNNIQMIRHYTVHTNIGTESRGMAIIHKDIYNLTDIRFMPSGRGIVATFNGIQIVNIYAHSRAGRKTEREKFFIVDVPRLLTRPATTMLLAGDFNCTLQNTECTGTPSTGRALRNLIAGMHLHDTWKARTEPRTYTHYTATGATRLDRIYVTDDLLRKKKSIEISRSFTDHLAVILHTECPMNTTTMGRGS